VNTRQKGSRGEDRAVDYLLGKGYRIVTRNYQSRNGEIDCIAESPDGSLVFIEVKSMHSGGGGCPLFWVNRRKQKKIATMAQQYLAEHELFGTACRFDVIAIVNDSIEHIRNAFLV